MELNIRQRIIVFIIAIIILMILAFIGTKVSEAAFGLDLGVKQVKLADEPTVYFLDHKHGFKKPYLSEAAYLSYGNKWSDVKAVSQEELNKWREAYLVKTANSPAVYYIAGDKKAIIPNKERFLEYGFKWEDILIITQADLNSYETIKFGFGGGPDETSRASKVSVNLDPTSPASSFTPLNTRDNLVAIFNFRSDKGIVAIKNLEISFQGVFDLSAITKVYIKELGSDSYLDDSNLSGQRLAVFNLNSKPIVISEGLAKKIAVYVDTGEVQRVENSEFYAVLENYNKINTTAWVSGNWPVKARAMKLAQSAGILAQVKAEQISLNTDSQAIVGNTDKQLAKYKVSETSDRENILIQEIIFENLGTARDEDLTDFVLKNSQNRVIARKEMPVDREIIFQLDDYQIKRGGYDYFTVYADVAGGTDTTVKLQLKDIKVKGVANGYFLKSDITHLDQTLTIGREPLGAVSLALKTNSKVFKEKQGSLVGVFEIRSDNQKMEINNIELALKRSSNSDTLPNMIYLVNYDTGEVLDYINPAKLEAGIVAVDLNDYKLEPKKELKLALVNEIPDTIATGATYQFVLSKITYRVADRNYYTDEVNIAGEIFNLYSSKLYIYKNDKEGEQNFTKGEKKAEIANFAIEASAGEDLKITSIALAKADNSGSITYDNGFSNLKFYIGSKKLGPTIEKPYSHTFSFEGFSYKLKNNQRSEIKVYADLDKNLRVSQTQMKITDLIVGGVDSGVKASVSGLDTASYTSFFGPAEAELTSLSGGGITTGQKENLIASFKVKNTGDEEIKLKYVTVSANGNGFSYSQGFENLKIVEKVKNKRTGRVSKPVAGANQVGLGSKKIKPGTEMEFEVYVDAGLNAPVGNVTVYFSDLIAEGVDSKVEATTAGDLTPGVVATASQGNASSNDNSDSNSDSNSNSDNSDNNLSNDTIDFNRPISGSISYDFHDPDYPFRNIMEHTGLDFNASVGRNVKAAANGTVVEVVAPMAGNYSYIIIEHSNSLRSIYGHLSQVNVSAGQIVKQGDVIGLSGGEPGQPGSGGNTNGSHLHFEIQLNGAPVDPEDYL